MTILRAPWAALLLLGLSLAAPAQAQDKPLVVASLPYLADVARQVGGDAIQVECLAQPGEDPHYVSPTPDQTLLLRRAAGFVENGISLEPWAKKVLEGAKNPRIARGQPGHLFAAEGVKTLDRPDPKTIEEGAHVHMGGNPHVWLDPSNLKRVAKNMERWLGKLVPGEQAAFANNRGRFEARLDDALYGPRLVKTLGAKTLDKLLQSGRLLGFVKSKEYKGQKLADLAGGWTKQALELSGLRVFTYHATWRYFEVAFGVEVRGTVEEKPGIPASPKHLQRLQGIAQRDGVRLIVMAPYYPATRADGLAQRLEGGKVLALPTQPGEDGTQDVFSMFDRIFAQLSRASSSG